MDTSLEGLTLHVEDVERSREFYVRIPGAALIHHRPGEFALLQIGKARLGLFARRLLGENPPPFHLEISTDDLDGLYEHLRASGLALSGPPQDYWWGDRTFTARDLDGNALEFEARHTGERSGGGRVPG